MRADVKIDGVIEPAGMTLDLIRNFEVLAPFGCGNPEPRFAIASARLLFVDKVGENHVRCKIASDQGRGIAGIAFRCSSDALGQALLNHDGAPLHLVGKLRENSWNGSVNPQFIIEDAASSWESQRGQMGY